MACGGGYRIAHLLRLETGAQQLAGFVELPGLTQAIFERGRRRQRLVTQVAG